MNWAGLPDEWEQASLKVDVKLSTRTACDPRLQVYLNLGAAQPHLDQNVTGLTDVIESVEDLETAMALYPDIFEAFIPSPYLNIAYEEGFCIDIVECPVSLPW